MSPLHTDGCRCRTYLFAQLTEGEVLDALLVVVAIVLQLAHHRVHVDPVDHGSALRVRRNRL